MNCYVFRINYDEHYKTIRNDILKGKLRQGWGTEGMDITKPYEDYLKAWRNVWGEESDEVYIRRKYNNIAMMSDMQVGDIIIIPKLNVQYENDWSSFTIAECKGSYSFSPINNDFGHIIPIKVIASCKYSHNASSNVITAKFKAYQKAINHVYSSDFINAVSELLKEAEEKTDNLNTIETSSIRMLYEPLSDAKSIYLERIVSEINKWQPRELEKIIEELFVKNGYTKLANQRYDRAGGDNDLVFDCFVPDSFMSDLYLLAGKDMPEIRIQAKNKKGKDTNDIEGVNQLIKMKKHDTFDNSINILINTTKEFDKETKELASKENIILINGQDFAKLLLKHGIDVLE